jgi:hypothetical protein
MKELRFKVKYGYTAMDRVSITDFELEKALYAQRFGIPVLLGGKQISGKEIKVIEPDYHYYTGWYESYVPNSGEDWLQIERDCPPMLENIIRHKRERIDYLISSNQKHLIGKNVEIPELDKPKEEVKQLPPDIQKLSDGLVNKFKI